MEHERHMHKHRSRRTPRKAGAGKGAENLAEKHLIHAVRPFGFPPSHLKSSRPCAHQSDAQTLSPLLTKDQALALSHGRVEAAARLAFAAASLLIAQERKQRQALSSSPTPHPPTPQAHPYDGSPRLVEGFPSLAGSLRLPLDPGL